MYSWISLDTPTGLAPDARAFHLDHADGEQGHYQNQTQQGQDQRGQAMFGAGCCGQLGKPEPGCPQVITVAGFHIAVIVGLPLRTPYRHDGPRA